MSDFSTLDTAGAADLGAPAPPTDFDDTGWYVLQCKPREEQRALEHLGNQGFTAFAPTCLVRRRRQGGARTVSEPLFPGYTFVRLSLTHGAWHVLRSTRGVRQLVRFGTHVPRLPDAVIERLRSVDGLALGAHRAPFQPGDRVRVLEGPFAGLEGVLQQADGEVRACVLLECMHRLVRVTVAAESLAPAR